MRISDLLSSTPRRGNLRTASQERSTQSPNNSSTSLFAFVVVPSLVNVVQSRGSGRCRQRSLLFLLSSSPWWLCFCLNGCEVMPLVRVSGLINWWLSCLPSSHVSSVRSRLGLHIPRSSAGHTANCYCSLASIRWLYHDLRHGLLRNFYYSPDILWILCLTSTVLSYAWSRPILYKCIWCPTEASGRDRVLWARPRWWPHTSKNCAATALEREQGPEYARWLSLPCYGPKLRWDPTLALTLRVQRVLSHFG